jgi:hypothetical protein
MLETLAQPRNQALYRTKLATALAGIRGASWIPKAAITMPGKSHEGPLPPLSARQKLLGDDALAIVAELAGRLAGRNQFRPAVLRRCEDFLTAQLAATGLAVSRQQYTSHGEQVCNLEVVIEGSSLRDETVVIGAHYDAVELKPEFGLCPAANDNGSGVATTIALAKLAMKRANAGNPPARTLRFVLWANEEPPFFWTSAMGSLVHARSLHARGEKVVAMMTPETCGCFFDAEGTQRYPLHELFVNHYPTRGNFIAFMGMHEGRDVIRHAIGTFRTHAALPSIGAGLPAIIPHVGASDHWSYWRMGFPGFMVTDTAPYRYNYYHTNEDLPKHMNFAMLGRVIDGLDAVVRSMAG